MAFTRLRNLVLALGLAWGTLPAAADDAVLRGCFAPEGKLAGDGLPQGGLLPHALASVLELAGSRLRTAMVPLADCLAAVGRGDPYDITVTWRHPALEADLAFLQPRLLSRPWHVVVLAGSPLADAGAESLAGKVLAYPRAADALGPLLAAAPGAVGRPVDGPSALFAPLEAGRVDALVLDRSRLVDALYLNVPHLRGRLRVLEPPLRVDVAAPAVGRHHPRRAALEGAYATAHAILMKDAWIRTLERRHQMAIPR